MKTLDEWLDYQENLHTKKIDLGLERIQKVYQKLFPNGVNFKVITVAGTNGKGSTIAFIDSIYQQVNIKVASLIKIKSQTPCPNRLPRFSNLVIGR